MHGNFEMYAHLFNSKFVTKRILHSKKKKKICYFHLDESYSKFDQPDGLKMNFLICYRKVNISLGVA